MTKFKELDAAGETYTADAVKGWIGITDKYWLTAFVPDQDGQADDLLPSNRCPSGPVNQRRSMPAPRLSVLLMVSV